ncbi:MAG: proline--tRNA ligase [Verrucomicrobia bacterium]|nr:proline--tRNA ligase [Verrucomicrobiota bacterium]
MNLTGPALLGPKQVAQQAQQALLPVTRKQNFGEWYRAVIAGADLATNSVVRGCMVIKPWGYGIWEQIQRQMDDLFKKHKCCQNAYFPLFIPTKLFAAEAQHVKGFAKECAVVTHYRMKLDDENNMIPDPEAQLEEPLVVRPTSETIIGDTMRQEIRSYRDLPLKYNQWCNVVRWEHQTNMFLRTAEFLWQEGHCAFANEKDARENMVQMAQVYRAFMTQVCAIPVIMGRKSPGERFAGAEETMCLEAMMQDGKALQAGTSHYLGQNFAKSSGIQFTDETQKTQYAHTTSWGVSTRLVGAMIMTHSDDDGLRVPPRLATHHVVVIPSGHKGIEERNKYIQEVEGLFDKAAYAGRAVSVHVDDRDMSPAEKQWEWIRKGAPLRFEIGAREAKEQTVTVSRRDQHYKEKVVVKINDLVPYVIQTLAEIQEKYYAQAKEFLETHISTKVEDFEQLQKHFADENNVGFVRVKWCGDPDTEEMLKPYKLTIRCLPEDQTGTQGKCVLTGQPATTDVIIGRSY